MSEERSTRSLVLLGLLMAVLMGGAYVAYQLAQPVETDETPVAERPGIRRPDVPAETFVGNLACRQCHADVADDFAQHPKSQSLTLIADNLEQLSPNSETAFQPAGRCEYLVRPGSDGLVHLERYSKEGEVLYEQGWPVSYVLGSGKRLRSFLIESKGALSQSPISWYRTEPHWGLTPGFVPDDAQRFDRRIDDQCLACHAGRVADLRDQFNRYEAKIFEHTTMQCEACHGPGQAHVDFHQANSSGGDPMLSLPKLPASKRDAVCFQCHLTGVERIPRYGRSEFDFRPGQELYDTLVFLSERSADADGEPANPVVEMLQSRCYQNSDAKLGCTSCHDPHQAETDPIQRVAAMRQRCLACHQNQGCALPEAKRLESQADDSCAACHMPTRPGTRQLHFTQTDHRILRTPERASRSSTPAGKSESKDTTFTFFQDANRHIGAFEVERALGLAYAKRVTVDQQQHLPIAERKLRDTLRQAPDDLPVLLELGRLALLTGDHNKASEYYVRAVQLAPASEQGIAGLGQVAYELGRFDVAARYVRAVVQMNPNDAQPRSVLADSLAKIGRLPEAIREAEEAVRLNPRLPMMREWLIEKYESLGNPNKAQEQRQLLQQMLSPAN